MAPNKNDTVFGDKIVTPKGRLAFPHLFEPATEGEYASGKYETTFLISKTTDISKLQDAVMTVAKKAFPSVNSWSDFDHPFRDGDEKPNLDGFPGSWFLKPRSKNQPAVVTADGSGTITDPEKVHNGVYARLSLMPFSYKSRGRPGVTFALKNVQFLADGPKFGGKGGDPRNDFGGAPPVEEEFGEVEF